VVTHTWDTKVAALMTLWWATRTDLSWRFDDNFINPASCWV